MDGCEDWLLLGVWGTCGDNFGFTGRTQRLWDGWIRQRLPQAERFVWIGRALRLLLPFPDLLCLPNFLPSANEWTNGPKTKNQNQRKQKNPNKSPTNTAHAIHPPSFPLSPLRILSWLLFSYVAAASNMLKREFSPLKWVHCRYPFALDRPSLMW